jgi:hypothetical protein
MSLNLFNSYVSIDPSLVQLLTWSSKVVESRSVGNGVNNGSATVAHLHCGPTDQPTVDDSYHQHEIAPFM